MRDAIDLTRQRPSLGWSLLVAFAIFLVWIAFSMESNYEADAQRHDLWFGVLSYLQVTATRPAPDAAWSFETSVAPGRLLWNLLLSVPIAVLLWRSRPGTATTVPS